jgi:hypothetical protein
MARVKFWGRCDRVCFRYSFYLNVREDTFSVAQGAFGVGVDHGLFFSGLAFALDEGDLIEIVSVDHNVYFFKLYSCQIIRMGCIIWYK